jgi:cell division septation protein DedD
MPYTMDGFRADVKKLVEAGKAEDALYRVQVGAFHRKDYAEAFLEQVRKSYPQAFLVKG